MKNIGKIYIINVLKDIFYLNFLPTNSYPFGFRFIIILLCLLFRYGHFLLANGYRKVHYSVDARFPRKQLPLKVSLHEILLENTLIYACKHFYFLKLYSQYIYLIIFYYFLKDLRILDGKAFGLVYTVTYACLRLSVGLSKTRKSVFDSK